MHMHQEPLTMLAQPMSGDALPLVKDFLTQQILKLRHSGVQANRIVLDPGIGFGKTLEQNLSLLQRQSELLSLGHPLMAGWSRKGTLGKLTAIQGKAPESKDRVGASVAAALIAVQNGASVVRSKKNNNHDQKILWNRWHSGHRWPSAHHARFRHALGARRRSCVAANGGSSCRFDWQRYANFWLHARKCAGVWL
jgi:dihydropteroate synthase